MSAGEQRARFTLGSARALRDRAARVSAHAAPRGRPRRRYLAEERSKLAARLLPMFALFAIVGVANAIVDVALGARGAPRIAVLAEASVAILLGGAAFAVPLARRSLDALVTLAAGSAVVAVVGWAVVARTSGQPTYAMILPLVVAAFTGLVSLPVGVTVGIGAVACGAVVLAGPGAPFTAYLLVAAAVVAGAVTARIRRRRSLAEFLRVERFGAALSRMRRVQDQLVVIEKLEALRVLVGGMAHELNNALAVSMGSSQQALRLLDAEAGSAPLTDATAVADAIRRGDAGLARIRRTVDRLRRFAMAAEGMLEPADVGAMLDFALESAIGRARSGVIVEREYDAVGAIECHVAALAEALFQIARNAVEAMPGGGRIHARVRTEGDRVILAVADEGHGIPQEELAKVFDPFYSRTALRGSRSGLGLSAVYGLVSALGGSVEVRSGVGKGTEVAIAMPRKRGRD